MQKKWLGFSNNLRIEGSYSLSAKAYQFALKKDLKGYQLGEKIIRYPKVVVAD